MASSRKRSDAKNFGRSDYEECFNPKSFIKELYPMPPDESGMVEFNLTIIKWLHSIFTSGKYSGKSLLDVCSGPGIRGIISASQAYTDITLMEYTDRNRAFLMQWINNKEAYDWSTITSYIAELERKSPAEIENRTCTAIRDVFPCDLLAEDPFNDLTGRVDAIISSLTVGAAVNDITSFKLALRKMSDRLNPGGHLFIIECLDDMRYFVDQKEFFYFNIPQGLIQATLQGLGFVIIEEFERIFKQDERRKVCPHQQHLCLIVAQKK